MTRLVPRALAGLLLAAAVPARATLAVAADDPVSHRAGAWLGACDNLLDCTLFGFSDDDAATLILALPHGRAASATLVLRPAHPLRVQALRLWPADRHAAPLTLRPDPQADTGPPRFGLDPAAAQALPAMLRAGGRLAVTLAGTLAGTGAATAAQARPPSLAVIRLAGAGPVLDWIARTRRHMPLPSVAPMVAAGSTPRRLGPGVPPPAVSSLAVTRACLSQDAEGPDDGAAGYALSQRFLLWQIPCGSGNFDRTSLFVLHDLESGVAAPALFATPPQVASRPPGMLVNAEIGADGLSLTATEPSRGLDDCGDVRRYRWDGARFRLSLARLMAACHGLAPEDWPAIYRDSQPGSEP